MYLSKLELHGFKSFADRTTLHFAPGVTAIVGPNGCGKSNIVDAVRWVIGEQRARVLRSNKMENIIFNGTSKRRQLGLSQVMLTIENTRGVLPTEYSEVTLGRRLYRSGESEYLLNGVKCRLRDIVDLFMDTGMGAGAYSVIELKMIEDILSDNAHDRRHLFEEAAGITKYKLRRSQTLRKLDNTQVDLDRLRDLIEEIEKNVRRLKRQAKKATRFKEVQTRLRYLELALSQVEYERLTDQIKSLQKSRQDLTDQITERTSQLAQAEAEHEALQTTLVDQEQQLAQRQQVLNAHLEQERALESDQRLEEERLQTARRDQERTTHAQAEAEQRRTQLERNVHRLTRAFGKAKPDLDHAEEALEVTRRSRKEASQAAESQQAMLNELRQNERQAAQVQADVQRRLDRASNRLDLQILERDRLQHEAARLDEDASDFESRVEQTARGYEVAQRRLVRAQEQLHETQAVYAQCEQHLQEARDALHDTEQQSAATTAEAQVLESLVNSYEDFSDAVQFLAQEPSWHTEPLLTVADVLGCDAAYRVALDTVLGDAASYIVVPTEREAQRALRLLRQQQQGQATFVVLDRLTPVDKLTGTAAPALRDHIRVAEAAYTPLADLLLHGWYLAETLSAANDILPNIPVLARVVTQAGEWLDQQGRVHGGSAKQKASSTASRLDRREQLLAVQHRKATLQSKVDEQEQAVAYAQARLQDVSVEAARQVVEEATHDLAQAEKAYNRATYEQQTQARSRANVAERLQDMERIIETAEAEQRTLQQRVEEAVTQSETVQTLRTQAEDAFQVAARRRREAAERFNETNVAAIQARNHHDNLSRDLHRAQQGLATLQAQLERYVEDLAYLRDTIATAQATIQTLRGQLHTAQNQRQGLQEATHAAETARTQTRAAISELDLRLRTLRREREVLIQEDNAQVVRLTELQTRTEDLLRHLQEDFEVSLEEEPVEVEPDFEEQPARQEVIALRKQIRSLGPINELALESYEEEKQRLDFLTEQLGDLEAAENTLLETIHEINTTATARFFDTFGQIQQHFARIFEELFGETATADLVLVDPKDPLESAIDIKAKPRGKKPSTIAQLSGGEKTLTAIALLFAIYLVKPSPFCILDEVDAPLDDANIDRFMNLIRSFADETQFIIVTHNKRSMELADRLYGITMQEQGISTLVSVAFDGADSGLEAEVTG